MASLMKLLNKSLFPKTNNAIISLTFIRNHWNKDFMPGPIPKTEEEIKQAAKKYNMTVADYKTYPDDGIGLGDYPKLPTLGASLKDPYYPWDFPELKRNYNEPLHADADMYGEDRYDANSKDRFSVRTQFISLAFALAFSYLLFWLCEQTKLHRPVLAKQYPHKGEVNYTFEPAK